MPERYKKIIVFVLFLLSVVGIAYALYWAFFRATPVSTPPSVEPTEQPRTGGLPSAAGGETPVFVDEEGAVTGLGEASDVAEGGVTTTTQLSTGPVYNSTLGSDGTSVNYYNRADGRFYRIDENGEVSALSDAQFPDVQNVTWNRNSEKAVLEFPDGTNIVYDFEQNSQVTLPSHWEDFDFSPVGDEIAAKSLGLDPNNRWLVTVNADGSNVRAFQGLGENEEKVQVAWSPNDQVVAFADTSTQAFDSQLDRKIIFPIGKEKENFKGLVVEGLDFRPSWSPSGKQLLYSVTGSYSNYRPLLWITDATPSTMGENRKSVALNTWAEKCTWASGSEVVCAVPKSLPANAGLQPTLYAGAPDDVYKVDTQTGLTTLLASPQRDTTMSDLFVSKDGSILYYRNASTGELEKMNLK